MTAERDEVCIALGDGSLRCVGFEAARIDQRALKNLTQFLCCNRLLPFGNQFTALYSRFNNMTIGQSTVIMLLCNMKENWLRTTVCLSTACPPRHHPTSTA